MRLIEPTAGKVFLNGTELTTLSGHALRTKRKDFQMIFQDPYAAFNPRMTVQKILEEPLKTYHIPKESWEKQIGDILRVTGISRDALSRYPHEFSGGQRQRVAIAKAIALQPEFLVCDEAVSALDVSIQSQIINLLMDLKENYGNMTYLFISHALNVVEHISDRVVVMYLGKIMETATTEELFDHPQHPYTQALLSAIPILSGRKKRERIVLKGEVPSAANVPPGCRFHTRCPYAEERCSQEEPQLREVAPGHQVACHKI